MTQDLTFDDASHMYTLNGRVVPGVTSVIGSHVQGWKAGEWYLERGKAVHAAVKLALDGRLDETSLDERIVGRVQSILNFIKDADLRVIESECRMSNYAMQFAGTADLLAYDPANRIVLCDWKSSIEPSVEIQLGGYSIMSVLRIDLACALECRDDGTYKAKWFTARELKNAANVFRAMLSVWGWKEKHNLNKQPVEV